VSGLLHGLRFAYCGSKSPMKITDPLNTKQLEVLRWIGDGFPAGVMTGSSYKTTAAALQSRRLVEIRRRGGKWSATVMAEGRYYLEHGRHPDWTRRLSPWFSLAW
jgi:hypothetical protein